VAIRWEARKALSGTSLSIVIERVPPCSSPSLRMAVMAWAALSQRFRRTRAIWTGSALAMAFTS